MGVVINPESELGKELARWDTPRSQGGMRPDSYEHYPLCLYKAQKQRNGQYAVALGMPARFMYPGGPLGDIEWDQACLAAEQFNRSCQLTVRNEQEERRAKDQGWMTSSLDALAKADALEREIADAAAEEHFRVKRMSELAQREHAEADASTHAHVTDVKPTKKRGRPSVKAVAPAPGAEADQ